jgi:thioredoxin 1
MVKVATDISEIPQKGAVVIDFFATWCGPCKRIAPAYERLAEALSSIVFLKVDVDESPELVNAFDVSSMPTFVFLKDGKEVKRVEGADMAQLESGFDLLTK